MLFLAQISGKRLRHARARAHSRPVILFLVVLHRRHAQARNFVRHQHHGTHFLHVMHAHHVSAIQNRGGHRGGGGENNLAPIPGVGQERLV